MAAESGDCDDIDACDRHWRVVHWAGGSGGRRRQWPKWKEIRLNHVPPPTFEKWGESDKEELIRLKTTEMDITKTALGRYAALMKRQAFASVLDFTDEEWTNLKKLREETSTAVATAAEATDETWMDAIEEPGELERDNTMIGGENGKGMV